MQQEYDLLIKNHTWTLVEPSNGRKIIPRKWVFKTKSGTNNDSIRHKARLVIKGCQQKKSIDYTDTFSSVIRYFSLGCLFALAMKRDLEIE